MKREFNLSYFITEGSNVFGNKKDVDIIEICHIKEFIKRLKEEAIDGDCNIEFIDKLSGDELK